jgi:hypothetical protein
MSPMRTIAPSVAALLLAACSSGAPAPAPAARPVPAPQARVAAPSPAASASAPQPLPPPDASGADASPFAVVLRSSEVDCEAHPFPGGAVLTSRSLMAVVLRDEVRQDPAFLAGLPEYINWDAHVSLALPVISKSLSAATIPEGAELLVSAGNRHGPGGTFHWNGRKWAAGGVPQDTRLSRLPRDPDTIQKVLALASGHLFVVRSERSGVMAYTLAPGATAPSKQQLPLKQKDWATAELVGTSPEQIYFCTFLGEIAVLRDGAWAAIAPPSGAPASCAATKDGSLWVVTGVGSDGQLHRRAPTGAWERIALPASTQPQRVTAAGDRVWVAARTKDGFELLSNEPVKTPIGIAEHQMPSAPDPGGITAFNQTSVPVLSVSVDPPGPGTSACSSLVVHLGTSRTPELEAALRKHPEMAGEQFVEAEGRAPGQVVLTSPNRAQMRYQPSSKKARAIAAIPRSFEEGQRMVEALAPDMPDAPPRLLCAKPAIVKR